MEDAVRIFRGADNYIADEDLLLTVNIAMSMDKPLLVKGEPGTGKTGLAEAIARALDKKLIIWSIKSTTKAADGLYQYDVVRRLYDTELGNEGAEDIGRYISLGKIGEAFSSEEQCVLLIDEIDKADLEFPNDLLWELDRMEFYITSNAEKELPDAFLRRCAFHYIAFPDRKLMKKIVLVHYPDLEDRLIDQVLEAFYYVRQDDGLKKKPGTGELLDWIKALTLSGICTDRLIEELPLAGFLIKKDEDMERLKNKRGVLY